VPPQLLALLRAHGAEQKGEREKAAQLWHDDGWVLTSPTDEPLKYHTDFREWKRLLRHAGLREARLHDARHTAATVLLLLGVPARTVMSLMGWSSAEMAARYQHVTDTIRQEVARQVDDLIWQARGEADPSVHRCPPPSANCPNTTGVVAGEPRRTEVNETETETGRLGGRCGEARIRSNAT